MKKNIQTSLLSLCALSVLSTACMKVDSNIPLIGKKESSSKSKKSNLVTNSSSSVNEEIGDDNVKLQVLSTKEFQLQMLAGKILGIGSEAGLKMLRELPSTSAKTKSIADKKMKSLKASEESLLLGIPFGLIGEQSIFGGVITKVSDKTNETLGGLKLTDLSPLHVKTAVSGGDQPSIVLIGCASACDEESKQVGLISFPIVGIDQENQKVILDLAPIGKELDLISMLDPEGEYTKLQTVSSATTAMDYSVSTLVFDIKSKMVPVGSDPTNAATPITEFTVRWYLKLNSAFNPAFSARNPTEGVGFFKTERSKTPKITRFSTTDFGSSVKYFIKNVPEKYKPVFAGAFDNWNKEFTSIIGRDLLSYEFVDATDPRSEAIVAGDIRYNVMEWDLNNIASYGGLGPSIANQFTGETLSANVLIQGPTIISLYTKWFELSKTARSLIADGRTHEANAIVASFNKEAKSEIASRSQNKYALKLGTGLDMNIHSQRAELEDPMIKNHFEVVPEGVTFDEYMTGYFTEMLEHELGHNLGLRHNFKGNLGAYENGDKGSVSRSIMEYLGRPYRHLSAIGLYDTMAISYGYRGVKPTKLNWFCTDEDQGSDKASLALKSPECTKSDATSDPYTFWESRLARAIDLVVDTKSSSAPVWKTSEVSSQVDEAITGLTAYAASAEKTMSTWTNFFGKGNRPEDVAGIKSFVLASIKKKICAPKLASIIAAKESQEAQKLAQDNLDALKAAVAKKVVDVAVYTTEEVKCN